jgi:UDP-N-acetylmuramate dehydrogenase
MDTLRKFLENCNIDAEIAFDEPMAGHTTFRIGGPADAFVRPRSVEALATLVMGARSRSLPITVIGGGANLLVGDRGVRGIVAATELLRGSNILADGSMYAEAGLAVTALVGEAADRGLAGLEFAAGLPGSVGGAVFMNARCYNREFADVLWRVDFVRPGNGSGLAVESITPDKAAWEYKRTPFMPGGALKGAIIVGAVFRLIRGDGASIRVRMAELEADRSAKGHFDNPSAGSMFKNDRAFGRPTGKILDELHFRGRRIGDAMVSPKHANIFVNAGHASAADMMALIIEAQQAARSAFGIELAPEVVFLGDF